MTDDPTTDIEPTPDDLATTDFTPATDEPSAVPDVTEAPAAEGAVIDATDDTAALDAAAAELGLGVGYTGLDMTPTAVAENIPAIMDGQPLGSYCEYLGGKWNFYRGGSRVAHGQGNTLTRAIQAVGSRYEMRHGLRVLVDESGEPLPPE
jgi:hypothetical protein